MKLTKRHLKRIIREEKSRLLIEADSEDASRFKEIMEEIAELVEEAFEISGRDESARGYWYNGILSRVDPGQHGFSNFGSVSMADTLVELGGEHEDVMEQGYNDGYEGRKPAYPENEYYMVNFRDGQDHAFEESAK